jgi:hypothetical protein
MCNNAAYYGKVGLLQFLRRNNCQWQVESVLSNASKSGSLPMLQWLARVTKSWSKDTMVNMLNDAASSDQLAAVKWLQARAAAWLDAFASEYMSMSDEIVRQCWSVSAVQWAVASGSGWRKWKCDDYAADKYEMYCSGHMPMAVLAHAIICSNSSSSSVNNSN